MQMSSKKDDMEQRIAVANALRQAARVLDEGGDYRPVHLAEAVDVVDAFTRPECRWPYATRGQKLRNLADLVDDGAGVGRLACSARSAAQTADSNTLRDVMQLA